MPPDRTELAAMVTGEGWRILAKYSATVLSYAILTLLNHTNDRIIRFVMDHPNKVAPAQRELRQHQRRLTPPGCLLSFAPFAPTISFNGDVEGEGVILNLSPGGCKITSDVGVKVGDAMSLILLLPGESSPTAVDLALVRWGGEACFGVEFVSMGTAEQARLRQFVAVASGGGS